LMALVVRVFWLHDEVDSLHDAMLAEQRVVAHVSMWHCAGLAAVGLVEVGVSIMLLLGCVYRRSNRCFQAGESPHNMRVEASCRCAMVNGVTLQEEVVTENKALRRVLNAAWLGTDIDIWDFEKRKMQSNDSSEVLSDHSTCDDMHTSVSSFSISDPSDVSDEDEDFIGFDAKQMERQNRTKLINIRDLMLDENESDDMQDDSPSASLIPSSIDLRDQDEEDQEEVIRAMASQVATGKWQNEDENLIRVMFARW